MTLSQFGDEQRAIFVEAVLAAAGGSPDLIVTILSVTEVTLTERLASREERRRDSAIALDSKRAMGLSGSGSMANPSSGSSGSDDAAREDRRREMAIALDSKRAMRDAGSTTERLAALEERRKEMVISLDGRRAMREGGSIPPPPSAPPSAPPSSESDAAAREVRRRGVGELGGRMATGHAGQGGGGLGGSKAAAGRRLLAVGISVATQVDGFSEDSIASAREALTLASLGTALEARQLPRATATGPIRL
ncbi:hypothetical protein T484DRAFT_2433319 [Baffinella frigidus]|nr:hypothetical protein T484DRAFT_2433319 [Cryptophyta sp. CCMP2293]